MDIHINTGSKWAALAIGVAALVLSPFDGVGICVGCSWAGRLSYTLFHVNILHAFCNAWCLVSLVFLYDLPWWKTALAFLVAVSIPPLAPLLTATPVVGMSGACFALMGLTVPVVRRKAMLLGWINLFLVLGFLFPNVAAWVHVYCFTVGLLAGLLIHAPWPRRK